MVEILSDFQAANISFLKMFLCWVKKARPQHETPEKKYKQCHFFDCHFFTEKDDLF